MKKCTECNSPAMSVPVIDGSIIRKTHIRNWGVQKPEKSFTIGYEMKTLDLCYYHHKKRLLKRK